MLVFSLFRYLSFQKQNRSLHVPWQKVGVLKINELSITLHNIQTIDVFFTTSSVLQIPDYKEAGSHSLVFWRKVSEESLKHTDLSVCIGQLFYLQWAIWLATCRFNIIQELEVKKTLQQVSPLDFYFFFFLFLALFLVIGRLGDCV